MTLGVNRIVGEFDRDRQSCLRIGAVGSILAGLSFIEPMHEAAAFEQQLIDIASTVELTCRQAFKFVDEAKACYEQMASEIGQSSETTEAGAGHMIAPALMSNRLMHPSVTSVRQRLRPMRNLTTWPVLRKA